MFLKFTLFLLWLGYSLIIVTAKKLTKDYGSLKAIDNIDFEILKGECFGFL